MVRSHSKALCVYVLLLGGMVIFAGLAIQRFGIAVLDADTQRNKSNTTSEVKAGVRRPATEGPESPSIEKEPVVNSRRTWENFWKMDFPGKAWGEEPRCEFHQTEVTPDFRNHWVNRTLDPFMSNNFKSNGFFFHGVEIGACQLKVAFPEYVRMTYVDMVADEQKLASQCFLTGGSQKPDILDNAEYLSKLGDNSFDILMAGHVLEHMQDVLGTLHNWLRVVRPGGFVFVAVPDLCDPTFPLGDRFRLVTKTEHFVSEFERKDVAEANFPAHALESGVSFAGLNRLREALGLPLFDKQNSEMPPIIDGDGIYEVPLALDPVEIEKFTKFGLAHPHNVHLHLWTAETMRRMLEAARPLYAKYGIHFKVVDVASSGRTIYNMQEVRFVLRRLLKD